MIAAFTAPSVFLITYLIHHARVARSLSTVRRGCAPSTSDFSSRTSCWRRSWLPLALTTSTRAGAAASTVTGGWRVSRCPSGLRLVSGVLVYFLLYTPVAEPRSPSRRQAQAKAKNVVVVARGAFTAARWAAFENRPRPRSLP